MRGGGNAPPSTEGTCTAAGCAAPRRHTAHWHAHMPYDAQYGKCKCAKRQSGQAGAATRSSRRMRLASRDRPQRALTGSVMSSSERPPMTGISWPILAEAQRHAFNRRRTRQLRHSGTRSTRGARGSCGTAARVQPAAHAAVVAQRHAFNRRRTRQCPHSGTRSTGGARGSGDTAARVQHVAHAAERASPAAGPTSSRASHRGRRRRRRPPRRRMRRPRLRASETSPGECDRKSILECRLWARGDSAAC